MYKFIRKVKKNWKTKLIIGYFVIAWYIGTFNFIFKNPSDISTGLIMLLMPFFVVLTHKPFRTFIFDMISVFVRSFHYKSGLTINIREIDNMDGLEFEKFLKPIFERQGCPIELPNVI
jgi:hypothetical protein